MTRARIPHTYIDALLSPNPHFSRCHCERSEAISQTSGDILLLTDGRDCFASLAMTLCSSLQMCKTRLHLSYRK
jgi:hypothetical protein